MQGLFAFWDNGSKPAPNPDSNLVAAGAACRMQLQPTGFTGPMERFRAPGKFVHQFQRLEDTEKSSLRLYY